MELKIKIKEVVEEIRPITREEHFAIKLEDFPLIVDRVAMDFLEDLGYVKGSLFSEVVAGKHTTEFGLATFRKETIRDATPSECVCWYDIQSWTAHTKNHGLSVTPYPSSIQNKLNELKGKEIILEVVE